MSITKIEVTENEVSINGKKYSRYSESSNDAPKDGQIMLLPIVIKTNKNVSKKTGKEFVSYANIGSGRFGGKQFSAMTRMNLSFYHAPIGSALSETDLLSV